LESYTDSLNGFDLNAAQLYVSQNYSNSTEQKLALYKLKREYLKQKFNIANTNSISNVQSILLSPQSGTNLDFESGNLNGWAISSGLNQNSSMMLTCCSTSGGTATLVNNGIDSINHYALNSPIGGNWVVKLNNDTSFHQKVTKISNTFSVTTNENLLKMAYMAVLNQCYHNCSENSYFNVTIFDSNNSIFYQKYVQANEGSNGCVGSNASNLILNGMFYSNPWEVLHIDLSAYVGSVFRIEITASGCSLGGHSAYGYFDMNLVQNNASPSIMSVNGSPYTINSQNQTISICNTNSVIISAPSGALSYTWAGGGGINGLHTQSVSILNPLGSYTVSYTKPAYWGGITSTIIRIENTPTISVTGPTIACSGSILSYSTIGANSYTWTPNNVVTPQVPYTLPSPAFISQTISIVAPNITTTYTISGSTTGGCRAVKYLTLNVKPTPTLSFTGQTNLCSGNSSTFILQGADSYTWTNPNITTYSANITPTQNTTLSAMGVDTINGCIGNINIPVSVYNPGIGISPLTPKVCLGDSIYINPYGATTYSLNNLPINNSIRLSPLSTTIYTLTGTNICGTYTSTFTVLVVPKPIVAITGPTTICSGYQLNLIASGAASYTWAPGFANTTTLTINNFTQSQDIYLTGSTNGCSASAMKTISVLSAPSATITALPKHNICTGQSATLTAVGAASYSWTQGGQTTSSIVVTPTASGYPSYYAVATGTNGCKASAYITMDVSTSSTPFSFISANTFTICNGSYASAQVCCSAASYLIENTNTVVSNQFTLAPTSSTIYTITSNSGCIVDTKTLQVTVLPSATYTISGPDSVCQGSIAYYTASGGPPGYSWSWANNPYTISNTYSVLCTSTNTLSFLSGNGGCVSNYSLNKIITMKPVKPVTIIGNIDNCSISNATLSAVGSDSYTWSNGFTGNPVLLNNQSLTTYSVLAQSLNGCTSSDSINLNTLTIQPSVFVTPVIQNRCMDNGQSSTLNAMPQGGEYYINGTLSSNTFTPISAGSYSVTYSYVNVNGCAGSSTASIAVYPNPSILISGSTQLCQNSSGHLSATGANSYTWSSGSTTSSVTVTPTTTSTYSVIGTDLNNCSNTQTVSVVVDSACQDVWPGDANSDGIANNLDVLELGLHFTQTGAPRVSTSNTWQSYFSNNWIGTITNGKNLNHSDCNGDGTINDNDTLAIFNNYGLTHTFKTAQTTIVNPQLSIVPDQAAVIKGSWGTASIYLGDATTNINNVNGVAFTVDFDNTLIEANSVYIEYQNSFVDAGQNLHFKKLDFANGKIFTATTHTTNNNVSGNGLIAKLHFQIKITLIAPSVLNLGLSQGYKSEIIGIVTPLTSGNGSLTATIDVGLQELNGNVVSISPNPTNGSLTINSKTELQKIEVVAITGQLLLSEVPTNVSHTLLLDNFANGIYFVNLYQNNRIVKREKVILNK
jgi:hypothetical protein